MSRRTWLDDPADLREEWLQGLPPQACVGVTAGASTPEFLVRAMLDRLESMGLEPAQEISSNSEGHALFLSQWSLR